MAGLLVKSEHGNSAGIVGALFLAQKALGEAQDGPAAVATSASASALTSCPFTKACDWCKGPGAVFALGIATGLAVAVLASKRRA